MIDLDSTFYRVSRISIELISLTLSILIRFRGVCVPGMPERSEGYELHLREGYSFLFVFFETNIANWFSLRALRLCVKTETKAL